MVKIIANTESNQEMRSVLRKITSCSEDQGVTKEILNAAHDLYSAYKSTDLKVPPDSISSFMATLESSLSDKEVKKLNSNIQRMRKRRENNAKTIELSGDDYNTFEEIKEYVYDEFGQQEITTSEVMEIILKAFLDGALDDTIEDLYKIHTK